MSDVFITRCRDYSEQEIKRAFSELIGQSEVLQTIKSGTRVVIKANLVAFLKPENAATTHPALLCELVKYLKERGASVVIGDSPGGIYSKAYVERIYAVTDMKLAELAGATLNHNFDTREVRFEKASVAKNFEYTAYLDDADMIINFCKLKSHGMMGMTGAVKNMFGVIPGLHKPEYHYRFPNNSDFANMLIDLNEYFKPCLSIVDAVIGMEGNGPTMGTPKYIGALLASSDPYKLDLACAHLIGLSKEGVPTLKEAYKRGLIPADVHELDISEDINSFVVSDFDVKPAVSDFSFYSQPGSRMGKVLGSVIRRIFTSRPGLGKKKCLACGKCAEICPAKAITIKNGKASINRKICIHCFCCQEFCPAGAMVSKQSFVSKVIFMRKGKK